MKKIVFLTTSFDKSTGGAIYDENFYEEVCKKYSGQVLLLTDEYFIEQHKNIFPNFVRYAQIYKENYKKITNADYLITNSRLYTRFYKFPWNKIKNNIQVIMLHHHFNYMTEHGLRSLLHKKLEFAFMKKADYIVTPNPYTLDICKRFGYGKKMVLIEAETLQNKILNTSSGMVKNFIFVGTVIERKGIHYAIKAFSNFYKQHKDFTFTIVGSYDEKSKYYNMLKKMIEKYHLEKAVIFTGRVSDDEKEKIYEHSYAFLFPSQNEGYGWVMIEAMQHGLPVIAFDNTAIPYTINKENGILVENKSTKKLAEAMEKIVADKKVYESLKKGALETVAQLPDKMYIEKQYQKFFEIMEK